MSGESHPDLDRLSDLYADVLPAAEVGELERHLQHCPNCRARADSLVEVRGALSAIGAEDPAMPAELATRLSEALQAETLQAQTGVSANAPVGEDGTDGDRTAALSSHAEGPSDAGAAAGEPSRDSRHVARTSRSGRVSRVRSRLARGVAVAAGVAVLAVGGTVAYQSFLTESAEQPPSATEKNGEQPGKGQDDGQSYALADRQLRLTEGDFDSQVRDAVVPRSQAEPKQNRPDSDEPGSTDSEPPGQTRTPDGTTKNDGNNGGLAKPNRCVEDALAEATGQQADGSPDGQARQVLDLRPARFDGEPAVLVITPGSATGTVHAWAISGCPSDGSVVHDTEIPVDR